ncbi:MAG: hypothetical protein ACPGNT_03365 [Rhodospirillales bacterium]
MSGSLPSFFNPFAWMANMASPGELSQWINPETQWFSPNITIYAGNAGLERRIVRDGASFGRQLGQLTDVVLELAKDSKTPAADQLRETAKKIEAIKERHRSGLNESAETALDALQAADPAAYAKLIAERAKKA